MRISDWSSDVCSSDLVVATRAGSSALIQFIAAWAVAAIVYFATQPSMLAQMTPGTFAAFMLAMLSLLQPVKSMGGVNEKLQRGITAGMGLFELLDEPVEVEQGARTLTRADGAIEFRDLRSEEHTSELQSLIRISYAVFCLK